MRLRGYEIWQRAHYASFAGEMPQRRNLDDTGRCRNDDNPLMQKRLSSADTNRHRLRSANAQRPSR